MLPAWRIVLVFCALSFCTSCHNESPASETSISNRYPVKVGGKWGYIDATGKLVIVPQFAEASIFTEGLAAVCVGRCDYVEIDDPRFKDLNLNLKTKTDYEGKWGYINEEGTIVITPQFDRVELFSEGFAPVFIGKRNFAGDDEGKWGYIDKTGKFISEPQFGKALIFNRYSDLAPVCVGKCSYTDKESKWGFINKEGKFVINPQFDNTTPFGKAKVAQVTVGHEKEEKIGYIDLSGKYIWNPQN
jgi:hypothetical protein